MDIVDIVHALIKLGAHADLIASVSGLAARAEVATAELERLAAIRELARQRASRYRHVTREKRKQNQSSDNVTVTSRPTIVSKTLLNDSSEEPLKESPTVGGTKRGGGFLRRNGNGFASITSQQAFHEFWQEYPKRAGANPKWKAEQKFVAILRSGVPFEKIMAGVMRLREQHEARSQIGTEFIPMAITWLNQRRWVPEDQGSLPLHVVRSQPSAAQLAERRRLIEEGERILNGQARD